jgi:hypothetical protein
MRKLLSLILALVTLFTAFAFTGCTPAEQNPTDSKKIDLADFEQYKPDFQLRRLMNNFGAVNVNKDEKYVKSGKVSAKLQPLGGYAQAKTPFLYFPLESERFEYNYTDMTKYESVSMWVYNAETATKNMEIGLVTSITDINTVEKIAGMVCSLVPGWNKVVYYPDLDIINLSYDVTAIPGVYIGFDNANSRDLEDAPVFYVDDVVITKTDVVKEFRDIIELDPGEIANFEKDYQKNILSLIVANAKCVPDMSIVTSAEAGVTATSGNKMLKVVTKPGDTPELTWPMFVIPEKVVRKSGYMNIPREDWSKYQICFDVYAETAAKTFYPEFFGSGGAGWKAYNVRAVKGQWSTFRLSLSDMVEAHVSDPGYIRIAWAEYVTGGEMTFYFDNFRYEKIA